MKLSFKLINEEVNPRCFITEQITGIVSSISFQEKVFEVADVVNTEIYFEIGTKTYPISKMKNIQFTFGNEDKMYNIEKSEMSGNYKLNGESFTTLEALYYALKEFV